MTEKKNKKSLWQRLMQNKAKILYLLGTFIVLVSSATALFFFTSIIRVTDGNYDIVMLSTFSQQEQILELANVSLESSDKVLYTSFDGNYRNIHISHGFTVPITVDGTEVTAQITQGTVSDCLANAGVVLGEHDYTEPSLHTQVKEGDSIRVYRVVYVDNQYEETVPYEVTYKSSSLTFRFPKKQYTLTEGQNGKNLVTYRERYVDGELDLALVSKVEVVKKPVNKLVLTYKAGKAVSPLEAPAGVSVVNGVPTGYSRVISNTSATGYYSKTGKGASRLGLFYGSVAVNPNIIPYGTKMYIASPDGKFVYGWAIATDTGTACMEGIIGVDLFYETYLESSLNWKNTVNIYIYD
ncbi:MAG: DUF348 domain-containing protein [Oscillospiraceae bacterium]|nr:DUF348 domain-containing protein [Oscillospiraceae bacterium]